MAYRGLFGTKKQIRHEDMPGAAFREVTVHKPQEIADALTERLKNAARNKTPVADVDRSAEIFPGHRYRDERGRMVTVQRVSRLRVTYTREGYRGVSEVGRREFDLKFKKVGL